MKSPTKSVLKMLFLSIFFLIIFDDHLDAIELLFPNGGETLIAEGVYTIVWKYTHKYEEELFNIDIDYSIDNGQTWENIATTWDTNWYQWQVPSVDSNQCLIRVHLFAWCAFVVGPCPWVADIDWDGDVDFDDYTLLASAWLSEPGDDNYYSFCDISNPKDNIINELDLMKFTDQWLFRSYSSATSDKTFTIFQF